MPKFLQLAVISCLCLSQQAFAGWLFAKNECSFEVWCAGAKNDGTFTEIRKVLPGQLYRSDLPAQNNNIGTVVKCAMNDAIHQPYQLEVNVENGLTWLDLSSIDGNPFLGYHRHAEVNGGLCALDCPPGSTACEYPVTMTCKTQADATLYLCSQGP
ncbi:hypothetical protein F5Y09DRAFT_357521 [Xylaria sp. FL1042]|nr:hypothetical protein F5Y09DRAFT_357521 [Xylaria sp. FL1042]